MEPLPAETSQLGELRARYGPNRANAKLFLYSTPIVVLIGLAFLLLGSGSTYLSDRLAFMGAGALILFSGAGLFLAYQGQLRMQVQVYADGFVFTNWRAQHTLLRWQDVVEVYEIINEHRTGSGRSTSWTYTVLAASGQRVKLNTAIEDVERLGQVIQSQVCRHLLPEVMRAYRAGETVPFGARIALNAQGLVCGRQALPWDQVSEILFSRAGDVWIGQRGRKGARQVIMHPEIANYPLLKTVVSRAVDQQPSDRQPLVHDQG